MVMLRLHLSLSFKEAVEPAITKTLVLLILHS